MSNMENDLTIIKSEQDQQQMLEKIALMTTMMREHQAAVVRLGTQRRRVIRKLRDIRVPYRSIAEACNVTDQAVFADLRKHPNE